MQKDCEHIICRTRRERIHCKGHKQVICNGYFRDPVSLFFANIII